MFLKREPGPRMVVLPDGSSMSRADLPDRETRRWVASRKARVVHAVEAELITAQEACGMYGLSEEELASWRSAVAEHGIKALRATSIQAYRHSEAESER